MSVINREAMIGAYVDWKRNTCPNDNVIFFKSNCFISQGLMAMNTPEMDVQKKIWKKLAKDGKITIRFGNSKTKTTEDGLTWHFLVVQPTNEDDCQMDPFGLLIMGEMVSGFVYAFKNKKHRDQVQQYVMKNLPQME